jgi:hypothetical protein
MRRRGLRIVILCLVTLFAGKATCGQQDGIKKVHFVVVPPEHMLLAIASQPDCPLQFEKAQILLEVGGPQWGAAYKVRNRGTKPIRSFTTSLLTSWGTGGTLGSGKPLESLIMPGQLAPCEDDPESDIIPLTDELRDRLRLREPMKAVMVLLVDRVVFADGTTYTFESTHRALLNYFDELDSRVP